MSLAATTINQNWSLLVSYGYFNAANLCTGFRVEDFLFDKMDKKRPNRLSNLEYLGLDMIEAGTEFGPGTAYGKSLLNKNLVILRP